MFCVLSALIEKSTCCKNENESTIFFLVFYFFCILHLFCSFFLLIAAISLSLCFCRTSFFQKIIFRPESIQKKFKNQKIYFKHTMLRYGCISLFQTNYFFYFYFIRIAFWLTLQQRMYFYF